MLKKDITAVELTPRQKQVLILFAKGLSYKHIARKLHPLSPKTVQAHIDAIRIKFCVETRRECIQKAYALRLLDTDSYDGLQN